MTDSDDAFSVQGQVRRPWRDFLDRLAPLRPDLHRYCTRLTGNVWDGEDLVQDTLLRVFGQLGRLDANLEQPARLPDPHGDTSLDRPRCAAASASARCRSRRRPRCRARRRPRRSAEPWGRCSRSSPRASAPPSC